MKQQSARITPRLCRLYTRHARLCRKCLILCFAQHPAVAKRILETIDWRLLLESVHDSHSYFLELVKVLKVEASDFLRVIPSRQSERLHT